MYWRSRIDRPVERGWRAGDNARLIVVHEFKAIAQVQVYLPSLQRIDKVVLGVEWSGHARAQKAHERGGIMS
ncbi:MAG: hypothetical protein ACHBNF_01750 [Chromatiales bacterium]